MLLICCCCCCCCCLAATTITFSFVGPVDNGGLAVDSFGVQYKKLGTDWNDATTQQLIWPVGAHTQYQLHDTDTHPPTGLLFRCCCCCCCCCGCCCVCGWPRPLFYFHFFSFSGFLPFRLFVSQMLSRSSSFLLVSFFRSSSFYLLSFFFSFPFFFLLQRFFQFLERVPTGICCFSLGFQLRLQNRFGNVVESNDLLFARFSSSFFL